MKTGLRHKTFEVQGDVLLNEPLAHHTSFRIGGAARYFVKPQSIEDVSAAIAFAQSQELPWHVLGNGTNILFDDKGFDGVVIHLGPGTDFNQVIVEEDRLYVEAGASLAAARRMCGKNGFRSMDFLVGIPATLGGALAMNAGIPEGAIGDLVTSVIALDSDGKLKQFSQSECEFEYRSSRIRREKLVVLAAQLNLDQGEQWDKFALMLRRKHQPNGHSPGCVFKNPSLSPKSAGWLIDKSGLKGYNVGDAQVSCSHANFILNRGQARSTDVLALIDIVREKVYKEFNLELNLELEVVLH